MQTLFALEWFDIPSHKITDKIRYHPFLVNMDKEQLDILENQDRLDVLIGFTLPLIISNRIFYSFKALKNRIFRYPVAMLFSFGCAFAYHEFFLKYLMKNEINNSALKQYMELDLNAEQM